MNEHACPGGCGQMIRRQLFACRTDWFRLPAVLRLGIRNSYRDKAWNVHRSYVRDALDWYKGNPR
jgi:hypothetical protein